MAEKLSEAIKNKLEGGGSISGSDVAGFARRTKKKQEAEKKKKDLMAEDSVVPVPDIVKEDPILQAAEATSSETASVQLGDEMVNPMAAAMAAAIQDFKDVEITVEDKAEFMNAIAEGRRMTAGFSLFGGRLNGILQARTNQESRALINELYLYSADPDNRVSMSEYHSLTRIAALRFQLVEVNGKKYEPYTQELTTVVSFEGEPGKKEKVETPPPWLEEINLMFGDMPDAWTDALFTEMRRFEYKYQTMLTQAANQDFWNPEASA